MAASSGLHRKEKNLAIGFKGDGFPGVYRRYILPLGESDATLPGFTIGPFGTLLLNAESLAVMTHLGVQILADATQRPRSQFESALLKSVHWFAESRIQLKPEYEIVTLAVAIESALAVPGKEGIGRNALAEAVAVLLSDDGSNRKSWFDLTRDALWRRGEVVHHGADVVEWERLSDFRDLVQKFLATAIHSTDRFSTSTELLSWVASRRAGLVRGR